MRLPYALFASLVLALPLVACGNGSVDNGNLDAASDDYIDPDDGPCFRAIPDGGTMCAPGTPMGQVCNYALTECTCLAPDNVWLCCQGDPQPTCADTPTQPKNGDLCCLAGDQVCGYGACVNNQQTVCGCVDHRWQCSTDTCPPTDDAGDNLDLYLFGSGDGGA